MMQMMNQAISTHRAHAHYIGKGGSLRSMMAVIYGKEWAFDMPASKNGMMGIAIGAALSGTWFKGPF